MVTALVVFILTCVCIVLTSVFKPTIKLGRFKIDLFWVISLLGAVILFIFSLKIDEWWCSLTKNDSINPIQILILFLSMSCISIFLDEVGFFSHLAKWTLSKVKKSQLVLFITLYVFVSVLTMFTSNDIIILTLTPFILFFCKNAKISPIPYLVSEFIAANTWSMIFIIGNPTNIYLASSFGIDFVEYFKVMFVPTLLTGIFEFLILFLLFRNKLKDPIIPQEISLEKQNIPLTVIGLIILGICTIFLVISGYFDIPMYLISAISFGVLVVVSLAYYLIKKEAPKELGKTIIRAPWKIVPFVIGMFILVLALEKYGVTESISSFFGVKGTTFVYGFSSALFANLINNIPMSVFYSSICSFADKSIALKAIYSSVIGSNIGAFLSPFGALAGIMWVSILKDYDVKFSYLDFVKYGSIVGIPALAVSLSSLLLFL